STGTGTRLPSAPRWNPCSPSRDASPTGRRWRRPSPPAWASPRVIWRSGSGATGRSCGSSGRSPPLPLRASRPLGCRASGPRPSRELAAHLLGFVGTDDRGLEGVELAHDKVLAGEPGVALVERDALGREVTAQPTILKAPVSGQSLVLTLDATIQYIAERELDQAWRSTGARAGMILVMDPRTGELLAVALRPTFNPNAYHAATASEWRDRAVTDPFEPGSPFKAILAAAALEEHVVRPDDRFYGEQGVITVANRRIHDWKRYGWLTFREVLQNSSNVGAI